VIHGVAAACLGGLLLVGTTLPVFRSSGPAFPDRIAAREGEPGRETDAEPVATLAAGEAAALRDAAADLSGPRQTVQPLDLNRADVEALQDLPGVGPALASRIVTFRETHGPFRTPEDLLRVPGIGAKRFARLQGHLRVPETP
jgi:competence protein ComEA